MIPFISKVLSNGTSALIDNVGKVIDNLVTSKEEKETLKNALISEINRNKEVMGEQAIKESEVYLQDVSNARESNVSIQNSEKASWMAKNVAYCIDCFVIFIWGSLTIYIIASALKIIKTVDVDLTGIYGLYATVTAVAMTIINFHRGSSKSSQEKDKSIKQLIDNNAI